jgi:hypothetical protein
MYIFGHVYLSDKNNPIGNIRIFIKKDGKELATGKTNASGLYEILSDNRSDYINLCMESTDTSKVKGVSLCEAVSVYQKLSRVVNGIELRDLEHDFYVNEKGENLNERLLKEIQNEPEDTAYEAYQATIEENKEKEILDTAIKKKEEEEKKERAKYRMPANTELPGPLKLIQAVGTLKVSDTSIDKKKIFVRVYTQEGKLLKERPIGEFYEFRFDIEPKEGGVFLHPLVLEIRSSEEQEFE